jgi:hypothetical protein
MEIAMSFGDAFARRFVVIMQNIGRNYHRDEWMADKLGGAFISVAVGGGAAASWKILGYVYDKAGGKHAVVQDPKSKGHYVQAPDGTLHPV